MSGGTHIFSVQFVGDELCHLIQEVPALEKLKEINGKVVEPTPACCC